uniref:Uncharacterized protein n=1 Tax=viral metagenome TaxID=1070528 RepID=A0A6C0HM68_9ZZZZ
MGDKILLLFLIVLLLLLFLIIFSGNPKHLNIYSLNVCVEFLLYSEKMFPYKKFFSSLVIAVFSMFILNMVFIFGFT